MAFNKRVRSVKAKRDKLNAELKQRQQESSNNTDTDSTTNKSTNKEDEKTAIVANSGEKEEANEETNACTCVKCSIVYHEAKIKGTTTSEIKCALSCSRCQQKLVNCKCCKTTTTTTCENDITTANHHSSSTALNMSPVSSSSNHLNSGGDSAKVVNLSASSSSPNSSYSSSSSSTSQSLKNEFVQFENKLFNIKNELVIIFITINVTKIVFVSVIYK
jgi:hypothetical protein